MVNIKKIDANLYIAENPYPCSRKDRNHQFIAFWAFFAYELYDQYRSSLIESEQGGAIPCVMEEFVGKPYSAFGGEPEITDDWVDEKDCKMLGEDDEDQIYIPYSFASLTNENEVREGAIAINWTLDWLASVEGGLHKEDTVRHWVFSRFIDVKREKNGDGREEKLLSFRIKTYYFRTGAFIKK